MKVAVQCESPLLQRSLELFLDQHLSSLKQCDLVIRDQKIMDSHHTLFVSSEPESDLTKPFSSSQLYLALEKFYDKIQDIQSVQAYDDEANNSNTLTLTKDPYVALEERIEKLTQAYKNSIIKEIKAFYE